MQWVGIDKVKKADGTTLEMGDALVALSTGTILDGAVTAAKLATDAITEAHTLAGTFTTASLSATAGILGSQLANTTVTGSKIANSTITNGKLAANAVTEAVTLAGTFTTASLNASANIAGTQLAAAAAIAGTQIAANTITESNITAKTITHASLSDTAGVLGSQCGVGVVKTLTGTLTYASTTGNITGMTIPAKSLVLDVFAVPTVAFNGTTFLISLEDSGAAGGFLANMTIANSQLTTLNVAVGADPAARGALLLNGLRAYYDSSNAVHATISHTGSPTTGAMTVYCVYVQLA
jgi:hypothetical protein